MIICRTILVLLALAGNLALCMGQTSAWVRGSVADSLTLEAIPGAVVEISDSTGKTLGYEMTGEDGSFLFSEAGPGEAFLKVSILGYRPRTIAFEKAGGGLDLGTILLCGEAFVLETAVHSDQAIRSSQSGDLDFSAGYSGRFTRNEYSGRYGKVNNNFLTQDVKAKVKWVFWLGFSVTAAANYLQYRSIDGRYNDELVPQHLRLRYFRYGEFRNRPLFFRSVRLPP